MKRKILIAVAVLSAMLQLCGCTAIVEPGTYNLNDGFRVVDPCEDKQYTTAQDFHYASDGTLESIDITITPKEGFTEDNLSNYTGGEFSKEDFSKESNGDYTLHVTEGTSFDVYKEMTQEETRNVFDMLNEIDTSGEEPPAIPEGRPSLMVGNMWFLDIDDGFELLMPGSLEYNVMQVYHYNEDESLKELDIVIVPLDGFDITKMSEYTDGAYKPEDFVKTAEGHYVMALKDGELFASAAATPKTETRNTLYDLWYRFATSLLN